jgi:hypothetical protein
MTVSSWVGSICCKNPAAQIAGLFLKTVAALDQGRAAQRDDAEATASRYVPAANNTQRMVRLNMGSAPDG